MGSRPKVLIAALVLTLAFAGVAFAGTGGRQLSTTLTGDEVSPGPGDPDATGRVELRLNQGKRRICFDLSWESIDGTVSLGHIREAPRGVLGETVVSLFQGAFRGTDSVSDCVSADRSVIKEIRKHPSDYYVAVHSTPDFAGGAIRGQLSK